MTDTPTLSARAMRQAAADWCTQEAANCIDAAKWRDGRSQYAKDCRAADYALRNAADRILALPDPSPAVLLAEAVKLPEVRALVEAARTGLDLIEQHEADMGDTYPAGDDLRAALAALAAMGQGQGGRE